MNELEILEFNYWEHFKYLKDLAMVLPPEHPKVIEIQQLINEMAIRINKLKQIS